jgi:hypothetical protein
MKKGMRERVSGGDVCDCCLNWLPNYCALDLTLLTCGNPTLPYEQNEIIFKHVFEYIKRSERFLSSPMYNKLQHYLIEHACI